MIPFIIVFLLNFIQGQVLDDYYHSTEELYGYLDSLNQIEEIDEWFHLDTIGYSTQDDIPILAVRISDNASVKEDEPGVLFIGQVHAEEILGVEIIVSLINDLLFPDANSYTHMNILKTYLDIWLIPTANPDGLNVIHDGLDLSYRKNKRDLSIDGPFPNGIFDYDPSIGNDIDGVDLNRNFDFNWALGDTFLEPDNSDYASHYDYYKGEFPFSENEAIAIRDIALENNFVFSIVWHSSRSGNLSEKVFSSWKWEEVKESPDLNIIKPIADQFSSLINTEDGTGTYLSVYSGSRNGKLHDWFYHQTGCIQYLVECGTANLQPFGDLIEDTIDRTKPAMVYLMDRAIGYYTDASQLTGIVLDATTNQPIEGAIVEILEQSGSILKPRITNEFGRYRRILEVGTYNVSFKAKGYENQTLTLVANNSAITNQDIYLEPAMVYNLDLELIHESLDFNIVSGLLSDEFGTYNIELNTGNNYFDLPENNYSLNFLMNDDLMPWANNFRLDSDKSFKIQYENVDRINLSESWNWPTINGPWYYNNLVMSSQQLDYYQNSDSTFSTNWMESNILDVSGSNRIVLKINHRYETEWDHDPIELSVLDLNDSIIVKKSWTGHNWIEDKIDLVSAISEQGFNQVKIRLEFKPDQTVNYRGWKINELILYSSYDNYLKTDKIINYNNPKIPLQINNIYPNPSNGKFRMSVSGNIDKDSRITVFNILGQQIKSFKLNNLRKGKQFIDFNFNSLNGKSSVSGMIFLRLETKKEQAVKKCIIIKN